KDSADLESVPSPLFRVWEGMPQSDVPEHLEPDLETEILTSFKYRGPICTYLDANELPADLLGTSCWLMRYIGSVARILLAKVKEIETGLSIALLKTKESGLSGFGLDQMSDEEDEDADELEDEPEEDAKVEAEPDHKPATPTTTRDSPFRSGARSQSITSSFGDSDTIEQLTSSALPELTRYVYAPAREVIAFEPISSDHRYDVQPPHYRLMPIEEAVKRADERRDLKKRLIQAKKEIVRTFLKEIESESDSGADEDEEPAGWRKWFPYRRRAELVAEATGGAGGSSSFRGDQNSARAFSKETDDRQGNRRKNRRPQNSAIRKPVPETIDSPPRPLTAPSSANRRPVRPPERSIVAPDATIRTAVESMAPGTTERDGDSPDISSISKF
ncbi:unnamed protein product, partial [Nesidiocoris tenuis]